MNKMLTGTIDTVIDLPKQVDEEVASDIEKESVFVSPHLDRITVSECRTKAVVKIRSQAHFDEVIDKASRYLDVMAKQLTGVTMNEPGVSRLVAVDIDAAVEMAAM